MFLPNIVDRIMPTPELTVAAVPSAQAQETFGDQNGGQLATKYHRFLLFLNKFMTFHKNLTKNIHNF